MRFPVLSRHLACWPLPNGGLRLSPKLRPGCAQLLQVAPSRTSRATPRASRGPSVILARPCVCSPCLPPRASTSPLGGLGCLRLREALNPLAICRLQVASPRVRANCQNSDDGSLHRLPNLPIVLQPFATRTSALESWQLASALSNGNRQPQTTHSTHNPEWSTPSLTQGPLQCHLEDTLPDKVCHKSDTRQ